MQNGMAKRVSRDQIFRRERGQRKNIVPCSADHELDWQPYPVNTYSAMNVLDFQRSSVVSIECTINNNINRHKLRGSINTTGPISYSNVTTSISTLPIMCIKLWC